MNTIELQKQLQNNSIDLQNFLKDLPSWEDEMKRKDEELKSGSDGNADPNVPPPRKLSKSMDRIKKTVENTSGRLQSSDYAAWDKFDAEAECQKIDQTEESPSDDEDEDVNVATKLRDEANYEKEKGNGFVKLAKWDEAIESYTKAIGCYSDDPIFYANRALCYLKKHIYTNAETDCTAALQLDKTYVKALQRRALAREKLGQIQDALSDLQIVLELEPKNTESAKAKAKLENLLPKVPIRQKTVIKGKVVTDETAPSSSSSQTKNRVETKITHIDRILPDGLSKNRGYDPSVRWPLGDFVRVIQPVKKLPHQRSKQSLTAIEIEEIEFSNGKIAESSTSMIDELSSTITDVKLNKTPLNQEQPTREPLNITEQIETPATVDLSDFPPPKSSVQFCSAWKLFSNNSRTKYEYLKRILPDDLPKIFGNSLESVLLSDLIQVVLERFLPNNDDVFNVLLHLSMVKRFSTLVMFMSSTDKFTLRKLFQYAKDVQKYPDDEVDDLIKKYEL